jgi:hypothetical protein
MAEKSYTGKISNAGPQVVKAPVSPSNKKGKSTVKKGDDLRK